MTSEAARRPDAAGRGAAVAAERPARLTTDSASFSRQTAHQFVYAALRRAILNGELPGGTRLVQSDIAKQLGVSATPVREALRSLSAERLVDVDPHRGAVVHGLTLADLKDLFEIRGLLEPLALRLAARHITEKALAAMQRIHDLMAEVRDIAVYTDLNRRFHELYREAAQSPQLHAVLTPLHDATAPYTGRVAVLHPEMFDLTRQDHADLMDGLRRRDEALLTEVILRHMHRIQLLGPPQWDADQGTP